MPPWEYLHLKVSEPELRTKYADGLDEDETTLQKLLESHGSFNWELVYVGRPSRVDYELIFKRAIPVGPT